MSTTAALEKALRDLMAAEGGEAGDSSEQKAAWAAAERALAFAEKRRQPRTSVKIPSWRRPIALIERSDIDAYTMIHLQRHGCVAIVYSNGRLRKAPTTPEGWKAAVDLSEERARVMAEALAAHEIAAGRAKP